MLASFFSYLFNVYNIPTTPYKYIYVIVILQVFHQKSTYLRPFFLSIWHQWIFWRYTNKSDGPIGKSRCVGSSCSDSDFWALGHVRNCRVSSIVNLQCHFIWFLQCVLGFWGLSPPDPLIYKGIIYMLATCFFFFILCPLLFYRCNCIIFS